MGLFENSVDLALEKNDLELAKINADMPEDDIPLRKKLWLKIAKYVVQEKQDIKTSVSPFRTQAGLADRLALARCTSWRTQIC